MKYECPTKTRSCVLKLSSSNRFFWKNVDRKTKIISELFLQGAHRTIVRFCKVELDPTQNSKMISEPNKDLLSGPPSIRFSLSDHSGHTPYVIFWAWAGSKNPTLDERCFEHKFISECNPQLPSRFCKVELLTKVITIFFPSIFILNHCN